MGMPRSRKAKVPVTDAAYSIYKIFIKDAVKGPRKDPDGKVILDVDDQQLLLMACVYDLLDQSKMSSVIIDILSFYLSDNPSYYAEYHWTKRIILLLASVKTTSRVLRTLTEKNPSLFDKRHHSEIFDWMTDIQRELSLSWYTGHIESIQPVLSFLFADFELER